MSHHHNDPKKQKEELRKWRRMRFLEALKYHHVPNAKKLEETTGKRAGVRPKDEGLNEDLQSKVGEKLHNLRSGLHTSRERARERGKAVFGKGR